MFCFVFFSALSADGFVDTAPATSALSYKRVRFNATLVIDSPYNREPSPEVDDAWRELLQCTSIKAAFSVSIKCVDEQSYRYEHWRC